MNQTITETEARRAFWGDPELQWITDMVNEAQGYIQDGQWYPGNGGTLADYLALVTD